MADWGNVYGFGKTDPAVRVRRLERGRQTLRRGLLVTGSSQYGAFPQDLLDGNSIQLSNPNITPQGAIAPFNVQGKFSFTGTDSAITAYWDGTNGSELLSLLRTSGEIVHIPGGSLTVSGLAASTSYGFLPYRSVFNNCGLGWVIGDSGSPMFAFTAAAKTQLAIQQQNLQGRESLTAGFITFSTAVGGGSTGPGDGTGGGGGVRPTCVMLGTEIEPLGDDYTTKHFRNKEWINLNAGMGRTLNCTPDHPLYHAERGKIRAEEFKVGDWIITDQGEKKLLEVRRFVRYCTKVQVSMDEGHLFWANGFLSHNVKTAVE